MIRRASANVRLMLFEGMLSIGALLLIGSGGMKLVDRAPTRGALSAAHLPSTDAAVVALAIAEIVVGAAVLVVDHPAPRVLLGAMYLGFAGFVVVALRNDLPIQSCGCFGKADTPPSWFHVAVNLIFVGIASFTMGAPPLLERLAAEPVAGAVLLGMSILGVYLTYLVLTELPATLSAARLGS